MKKQKNTDKKSKAVRYGLLMGCLFSCAGMLTACGKEKKAEIPTVKLSLWIDSRNMSFFEDALKEFEDEYANQAKFDFTVSVESELSCKETVLNDPEGAADIFIFADDQLEELWRADTLLEITEDVPEILKAVGGAESGAATAAMRESKLYAYPLAAGNGYFLYYNKAYFTEDDVKSLDRILEVAAANQKKFSMDFTSGWYIYSFFKAAGLDISCNEDGVTNRCNWNATDTPYTGVDVVNSMLDIAKSEGFVSCQDTKFVEGVQDGTIIAGVNGAWNADYIEKAWGENYGAAKLPEFTLKGDSVQMCSFNGYKLVGVSAHTKSPEWAMKLAKFITSEEMQLKRFEEIGECPANVNVWELEEVQNSPAFSALKEQEEYGYVQNLANPFWDASCILGTTIASGNGDRKDLQELLDEAVEKITAKP